MPDYRFIIQGATLFTDLNDTPNSYTGMGGRVVQVDPQEDKLRFAPPGEGSLVDADKLDGLHASDFVPKTRRINTGTGLTGGGDLSADRTLSVVNDTTVQKVEVALNGTLVSTRKRLNFIAGTGVNISISDDTVNNRANITISSTGGGTSTPYILSAQMPVTTVNALNSVYFCHYFVPYGYGIRVIVVALSGFIASGYNPQNPVRCYVYLEDEEGYAWGYWDTGTYGTNTYFTPNTLYPDLSGVRMSLRFYNASSYTIIGWASVTFAVEEII